MSGSVRQKDSENEEPQKAEKEEMDGEKGTTVTISSRLGPPRARGTLDSNVCVRQAEEFWRVDGQMGHGGKSKQTPKSYHRYTKQ